MPPIINYENKTVVVTGAATGVGAALIDRLRAAHAERIIALDIKPCRGPIDQFVLADLSDPVAIDDAIHQLPESIDVLFNNAGVAATLPLRAVIGINVLAPRRLTAELHQRMPPGSAVVNTEPPRDVRRLHFLGRMGSCQRIRRGGIRRSCVSERCGWWSKSAINTRPSGQRCARFGVARCWDH
jgi:nucleoside-diphosphate-sugar epimerase